MSLAFPPEVGSSASPWAQENLKKLLRADARGPRDQVATNVALECFQRMQELNPGYFEGIKSWVKAGGVYALSGTVAAGAIALSGWSLYEAGRNILTPTQVAALVAAVGTGGWISSELGFKPLGGLVTFLAVTVRDAANRAAKWSVKKDERSLQEKEKEAKECHQAILNQLSVVYNDSGKKLHEMFSAAEKTHNPQKLLEIQQIASKLEERLPTIKKLLQQFLLSNYEIESVMQGLTNTTRFVQAHAFQLKPKYEGMNCGLIAGCPISSVSQMAVPVDIQDRIAAAKLSRFTFTDQVKGYGSAALTGGKAFVGLTAALAAIAAVYSCSQFGLGATVQQVSKFFTDRNWSLSSDTNLNVVLGGAALGVVGASAAVTVNKSQNFHNTVQSNSQYVRQEINQSKEELKMIYDGIGHYFNTLTGSEKLKIASALVDRIPVINHEIKNQGFDPAEITGKLEEAAFSACQPGAPTIEPWNYSKLPPPRREIPSTKLA